MKRFFVFLVVLCIMICTINLPSMQYYAQRQDGNYYFYTTQNYKSALTTCVKNGQGYVVKCNIKHAQLVRKSLNSNMLLGESFAIDSKQNDINALLKKLNILYKIKNDLDIIAYSPQIPYKIYLDGKIYNVQISQNKGIMYVGFPAILGDF